MAVQFSEASRHAALDAIVAAIGASATLELRTGAPPATTAAADSGTLLATMALPATPFAAAVAGARPKSGTWADPNVDVAGTIGHFRIKNGATTHIQGTVTLDGGGGDMTTSNTVVGVGQEITVVSFQIAAGGG